MGGYSSYTPSTPRTPTVEEELGKKVAAYRRLRNTEEKRTALIEIHEFAERKKKSFIETMLSGEREIKNFFPVIEIEGKLNDSVNPRDLKEKLTSYAIPSSLE